MKRNAPRKSEMSPDQMLVNRFRQVTHRILSSTNLTARSAIASKLGKSFGGKRDIYTALGYPGLLELTFDHYMSQYKRGDIAGRLIDAPVDGCWQLKPAVIEDEQDETPFEKAWADIVKKHHVWQTLIRADKLSRIGNYGVILIGLSDVKKPSDLKQEPKGKSQLLFLQPYGQSSAEIMTWDNNAASPRYGLPLEYRLTQQEPASQTGISAKATATRQVTVHYSRVIHIAEGLLESNVYGTPALERVYNRLLNLELIVGGSAEMFWQGAFPGYAFVADSETDMSQTADQLEAEIDLFVHDFRRYMKLGGMKVEKLSSEVASPEAHVEVQLKMVSIASGIPKRILEGSERGELSSNQDEGSWNDKLKSRQDDHIEPQILRALIDRLIQYGILPEPGSGEYAIEWPDLNAPTDKDKADVGKTRSEAIKNYFAAPATEQVLPFESFLEEILELDPESVKRIVDAAGGTLEREIDEEQAALEDEAALIEEGQEGANAEV